MISTDILNAVGIMLGSQEAEALYIGSNLIWLQSSPLPYDAEILYLEGNGNLKITLNFDNITNDMIANNKLEYITNIQLTSTDDGAEGINNLYYFVGVTGNKYYSGCGPNWLRSGGVPDLNSHELKLVIENNTVKYYLDNNIIDTYSFNRGFNDDLNKFGLFYCIGYNGPALNKLRKSYAKLTLGNQIIFECIPVRVGLVGYIYDKVSKQLLSNQGTGSFTLGLDKSYTKLQYISSTSDGSLYIDLGVKLYETLNTNYDIAMKFNFKGNGSDNSLPTLFGCLNQTDPWPGTFIRISSSGATQVTGRYIGKNTKDNNLGSKNSIIELPVQISPNKNVYNLNNSGLTHNWSTSLFCAFSDNIGTPFRFAEADLYYFKLFVEGVLVRNMVPCKNSSNVVGLYDLVERVFYSSPNNATFVAGPVEVN